VTGRQRQENIDRFQTDRDCRIMIANQGAGGVGCNLTAASHSIYYSRNFSLEHDLQSEARNYRGGSEIHTKITRIDLVAPDTIDATVLKALADKVNVADAILNWVDRV
jgi:SNF2 family DNA or RNA helicase